MADEDSTSYLLVNSQAISSMAGKTVTLTGRLAGIANGRATLETSDNGRVIVHVNQTIAAKPPMFLEVVGMAERDGSVRMVSYVQLSEDIDMRLLDEAIRLQFAHMPLFDFPNQQ